LNYRKTKIFAKNKDKCYILNKNDFNGSNAPVLVVNNNKVSEKPTISCNIFLYFQDKFNNNFYF